MIIIYHKRYDEVYSHDPAAESGRMECILREISNYNFVEPDSARDQDLMLVHTESHIKYVKSLGSVFEIARLASGGAIKTAEIAFEGKPSFGLIRPPGHHASSDSCWGFCYFNNIAIAIEKLRKSSKIERALIVDIDLHYGDGTNNIFSNIQEVTYLHMPYEKSLEMLNNHLRREKEYDILAVSAGFDRHKDDWGGMLRTEDYEKIGRIIKENSEIICKGRRFAVLEGGYNHQVLGKNVKALLQGMG